MTAEFKTIRIAEASPVAWRKVERNQGRGAVNRLPCPRLTRTGTYSDTAALIILSSEICASRVNLFHDGHGRIAIQPDNRGDYVVSQENRSDRSRINIPKVLMPMVPKGNTPVTLEKDGDLIVVVISETGGVS